MPAIEDHEVVQAVSPNGTDQAFDVRILPRTLRRREYFLDLQERDSQTNVVAVHAIPIAEQIARRCVVAEGLDDLLGSPGRRRMLRHIEVQHLATPVFREPSAALRTKAAWPISARNRRPEYGERRFARSRDGGRSQIC